MKEPWWISREVLIAIHAELAARFGGLGELRDSGLLDSALERPGQIFHYAEPDLFALAAVYAEGIGLLVRLGSRSAVMDSSDYWPTKKRETT